MEDFGPINNSYMRFHSNFLMACWSIRGKERQSPVSHGSEVVGLQLKEVERGKKKRQISKLWSLSQHLSQNIDTWSLRP
jgi:hypothetical protein